MSPTSVLKTIKDSESRSIKEVRRFVEMEAVIYVSDRMHSMKETEA